MSSDETPTRTTAPSEASNQDALAEGGFALGTVLAGRYRMLGLLGKGGMGEVYRAEDLKLRQTVALKFLPPSLAGDPTRLTRFLNEVRLARRVSHPNVCRVHDIGEVDRQHFISMEYVDGEDLAALLSRIGRLASDKAVEIGRQICGGLAAAHDKGVLHRDLKPSNVMIDGRGVAHLTDFGLAVVAGDSGGDGRIAGTPAYMSPEQAQGNASSVQTDLYALGLVLYEMFTGQRAFRGRSVEDVLRKHLDTLPAPPSTHVPDLEPSIERVILRCLEKEPSQRPQSALAVSSALPGGDPLAAMLAAGQTPPPEMVAAAGELGELRLAGAWGGLGFVIAAVIVAVGLHDRSMLYARTLLPSPPEVLEQKAKEVLSRAGLSEPELAADTASWFFHQPEYLMHVAASDSSPQRWMRLRGPPHAAILFHYRQSPRPLVARLYRSDYRVTRDDPPLDVPGMKSVTLDPAGALVELVSVPPRRVALEGDAPGIDWDALLTHAGAGIQSLTEASPSWTAPVDSDLKKAWTGTARDGHTALRVEAAAYHGRPVWFSVIYPWKSVEETDPAGTSAVNRFAITVQIAFLIALPISAFLLARRNLQRGRGDRKGALKIAVFSLCVVFLARLFRADHTTSFGDEWRLLSYTVAECTFWALNVWVAWIAVEPFVRRRWPQTLISWSRLLEGRFRDPMIGRDVLVGFGAGLLVIIVWDLTSVLPIWLGLAPGPPLVVAMTPLGSPRHTAFFLLWNVFEAIARSFGLIAGLVVLRGVLRSQRGSVGIMFVLLGVSVLGDPTGALAFRIGYAVVAAAVALLLIFRFGLLALAAFAWIILDLWTLPVTFDPAAWYFGQSAVTLALIVGIAACAFVTALGGKPLFGRLTFED